MNIPYIGLSICFLYYMYIDEGYGMHTMFVFYYRATAISYPNLDHS